MKWIDKSPFFMAILLTSMVSICWADPAKKDFSMVKLIMRDGREILGRIQRCRNGRYQLTQAKGACVTVSVMDVRKMVMAPETTVKVPIRKISKYVPPTQREIFKMALDELRNERKDERRKRMEAAKGNVAQLGLGNLVNKIGDDIQDNLLDLLANDKELQSIIMDEDVQKSIEGNDVMSLMKNEKILNMMRNPDKVKRLVGAVLGDDDEKTKKREKNK